MCVAGCLIEYGAHALIRRLDAVSRARVLQKWSSRLLSGINAIITVNGQLPERGLIASNHLSYLDILVFSAVCGCVFVSKREIKSWPAVGWISSLAGTIYIDRTRRAETHAVQPEMQSALSRGLLLVLFPEGTSSDGSRVLHFHSSLFQPAIDLDAPVTAAAIDYFIPDGDAAREACYWGEMKLFPHLLNLMSKESVRVRLGFSEEHLQFSDRKQAAQTMHRQVERLRGINAGHMSATPVYEG
jgi:lyso-ornithine lipid O-acyltransferase